MKKKGGFYSVFFGTGIVACRRISSGRDHFPIFPFFSTERAGERDVLPVMPDKARITLVRHAYKFSVLQITGGKRLTKQVFYGMITTVIQNGLVYKNGNNRQSFDIIHANSRYKLRFILVCYLFNLMHKYKSVCMGYRRSHENKE